MKQSPIVRFAPSPNGYLHLGHAYSALLNHRFAVENQGRFLLRIEDIDIGRSRPEFIAAIYEDLDWLGIEWERPVRRQSEHFEAYKNAAEKFGAMGLLYPCSASRKEIMAYIETLPNAEDYPRDPDRGFIYPGLNRGTSLKAYNSTAKQHALRLDISKAMEYLANRQLLPLMETLFFDIKEDGGREIRRYEGIEKATESYITRPTQWGDVVLVRKDVPTSYHLSVVVDDALQGITHIIRGRDLESATSLHRLLQVLLGLDAPFYHHHKLITAEHSEKKLSKSAKDTSLHSLRQQGWSADDVKEFLFGN